MGKGKGSDVNGREWSAELARGKCQSGGLAAPECVEEFASIDWVLGELSGLGLTGMVI